MKYYAVTDDPRELMHYGIKGMKWGVIRTPQQLGHLKETVSKLRGFPKKQTNSGNGPRSAAYTRAYNKLSEAMRKGIKKAESSWAAYNSPSAKRARTLRKNEKLYQKHLELARKGKLKYKDVSDTEVDRITDRLAAERQSRQLSGTEQRFRSRLGAAISAGIISGAGQATANITSERLSRRSKMKSARMQAEQNRELELEKNRQINKQQRKFEKKKREEDLKYNNSREKAQAEAQGQLYKEYYKALTDSGEFGGNRVNRVMSRYLSNYNDRKDEAANRSTYNKKYQEILATNKAKHDADFYKLDETDRRARAKQEQENRLQAEQAAREREARDARERIEYRQNMRLAAERAEREQEAHRAAEAQREADRAAEQYRQRRLESEQMRQGTQILRNDLDRISGRTADRAATRQSAQARQQSAIDRRKESNNRAALDQFMREQQASQQRMENLHRAAETARARAANQARIESQARIAESARREAERAARQEEAERAAADWRRRQAEREYQGRHQHNYTRHERRRRR